MRRTFREDRSGRTGGAPSLSALTMALNSASFFAPLTSSLALSKGTGSATFTRATTATCMGFAPGAFPGDAQVLLFCAVGEARFSGARKISAGVWSDYYADGTLIPIALRLGYLAEGAATNLFLNSAVGVTQTTPALTAAAYTLSFKGTGSIVGTGGFVGTLAGTGAANRVSLPVTATAAAATLAVTGSCTEVQIELGSFATSYIPTVATAVTRNADVLTYPSGGNATATGTMYVEAVISGQTPSYNQLLDLGNAAASLNNTPAQLKGSLTGLLDAVATTSLGYTSGKVAFRHASGKYGISKNGVVTTSATTNTPASPSTINIGTNVVGTNHINGNIRNVRLFTTQLTDAQLVQITS